jgi:hypothetical protein
MTARALTRFNQIWLHARDKQIARIRLNLKRSVILFIWNIPSALSPRHIVSGARKMVFAHHLHFYQSTIKIGWSAIQLLAVGPCLMVGEESKSLSSWNDESSDPNSILDFGIAQMYGVRTMQFGVSIILSRSYGLPLQSIHISKIASLLSMVKVSMDSTPYRNRLAVTRPVFLVKPSVSEFWSLVSGSPQIVSDCGRGYSVLRSLRKPSVPKLLVEGGS